MILQFLIKWLPWLLSIDHIPVLGLVQPVSTVAILKIQDHNIFSNAFAFSSTLSVIVKENQMYGYYFPRSTHLINLLIYLRSEHDIPCSTTAFLNTQVAIMYSGKHVSSKRCWVWHSGLLSLWHHHFVTFRRRNCKTHGLSPGFVLWSSAISRLHSGRSSY